MVVKTRSAGPDYAVQQSFAHLRKDRPESRAPGPSQEVAMVRADTEAGVVPTERGKPGVKLEVAGG